MSAVMDGTGLPENVNTAFVELFLEEYERLLRYFGARINQRDEAGDLAHEVYLRLIEIPADRVIERDRGYLWAVAKSVLLRFLERSSRSVPLDPDDAVFEPLLSQDPQIDADIDRDTFVALLHRHYVMLPPKCRAAMQLRWFHELSYEEIADRCGISVHMVHKHLKKGLKLLRQRMEQTDE